MFGGDTDEGPIAFRRMNDSENFSDRCRPSDDCWPSESEWDSLDEALGGKLMRDVKPYLSPCRSLFSLDVCEERGDNYSDAYYRDDIPGTMMMPAFECDIGEAKCCLDNLICHQGNVNKYAVNVT